MTTATTNQAQAGADKLAELVHAHQVDVWRYLRYLGCDPALADDLTQETFLEIHRRPFEQRTPRQTAAYLRKVARNQLLMVVRRNGRRPIPLPIDLDLADQAWEEAARDDGLEDYLAHLRACLESAVTERVRTALTLFYRDEQGRDEIAQQLNMSADGVKTMLRRARTALRECIERKRMR